MESEDYWNKSENKAFSFDEDDRVMSSDSTQLFTTLKDIRNYSQTILNIPTERKLFVDDNTSELSYDFPSSDIPLHLIISDSDLNKGTLIRLSRRLSSVLMETFSDSKSVTGTVNG